MDDIEDDYYELLNVPVTATTQEVSKAYRLTKAVETLTDTEKRAKYDVSHKAKLQQKAKLEKLDSKRRQDRADLERRENEAKRQRTDAQSARDDMKAEKERLRAAGLRILEEYMMKEEQESEDIRETAAKDTLSDINRDRTIRVKWKRKVQDFTRAELEDIFKQYGRDFDMVLSKGLCLLRFKDPLAADLCFNTKLSRIPPNLELSWVTPPLEKEEEFKTADTQPASPAKPPPPIVPLSSAGEGLSIADYEMQTLLRMRNLKKKPIIE
ncbi:hypothetical protein HDV05_007678 [Chytridiales sp. JEL 0842]|nr:hypothetical protein HDV05_007678 [Chytridiales sp. JEL 0842]